MTGGTRTAANFLESENFIRGSVLRAGFVSDILLECPLYDTYSSKNSRNNWIELKDKNGKCLNCSKKDICEKFSEMTFSFAYPEGSIPAPFTTRVCKKCGTEHPLQDTIIDIGRISCSKCKGKIRRMENLKGFINVSENRYSSVKVKKSVSVHTAINYNSKTTLDGSLFSVNAIKKRQLFTAYIDDKDTGMLREGKVIYVGKYSSSGFGKLLIKEIDKYEEPDLEKDIYEFNEKFADIAVSGRTYVPLLLLSDAKFDFGDSFKKIKTNKEYMQLWQEKVFGVNSKLTVSDCLRLATSLGGDRILVLPDAFSSAEEIDSHFKNIEKYPVSTVVMRLTTDMRMMRMAYVSIVRLLVRAPFNLAISAYMIFKIRRISSGDSASSAGLYRFS